MWYRLRYAEKGIRTSPADVKNKKPCLTGWQEKATTNPQQITAESNAWPEAGILTPTGETDGRWVLDVDSPEDLEKLEKELGIRVRGTSTEVRTQRGRLQIHFLWPEGGDIRNSVGKMVRDGFEGLDVRGEGGLALLPPSAGYGFANDLPTAAAPPELVEWATGRTRSPSRNAGGARRRGDKSPDGELLPEGKTVPEGARNSFLTSQCGRLHDGTRTHAQLTEDLDTINRERCSPPSPRREVEKIALWFYEKRQPCKKRPREPSPEVEEVLRRASDHWYDEILRGGGKSKLRDVFRAILQAAAKRRELGTVEVDGEERRGAAFSDSCRQLAERANTSAMSVSRHLRTLERMGVLLQKVPGDEEREGLAPTRLLLEPAQGCYTPINPSPLPAGREVDWGVTLPRADELGTPMYGWRSPVGNAGGGVEAALEAFGRLTTEELTERLGISRPRDLERRHLDRLAAMGVVEEVGGRWGRPADHRQRAARRWREPYGTVHRRRVRRRTDEGRKVVEVEETVVVASEAEREKRRCREHGRQREVYRKRRRLAGPEADEACRQLLNAWDDERELGSGFISELEPVEAGGAHASSGSRPGSSSRPSRRGPEVVDGVHG